MKRDAIALDRRKFLKFGVLAGAGALANSICPGATWSATRGMPVSETEASIPVSLDQTLVGPKTAAENNWRQVR